MESLRQRTIWTWKLIAYPLVVIPAIIYVATAGSLAKTEASLRLAGEASGGQSAATPIQGVTRDGKAFVCPPPRYPVEQLCWMLPQRDRVI